MVDTKTAERRDLDYQSLDEVIADLGRIEASMEAGTLTSTGNWTPGENMEHTGKFLSFAIDGFPSLAPLPVRLMMILFIKKKAITPGKPIPAGFQLPKAAGYMLPTPGISAREGYDLLRQQVGRLEAGERMTHPSAIFGKLTHEQWLIIQLKHMSLHLSFLHPGGAVQESV